MYGILVGLLTVVICPIGYVAIKQFENLLRYRLSGCKVVSTKERFLLGSFEPGAPHLRLKRQFQQYGPVYYTSDFHLPSIVVADPDIIQYALSTSNMPKAISAQRLSRVWGKTLLSLNHFQNTAYGTSPWKKERRMLEPGFRSSYLRNLHNGFGIHAVAYTKKVLKRCQNPQTSFDIASETSLLTMEIISTTGFSYPLDMMEKGQTPFLSAVQDVTRIVISPWLLFPEGARIIYWSHRKIFQTVDEVFYGVIDSRLKEIEEGKRELKMDDDGKAKPQDLLDMMLIPDEEGNRLTREQMRNELLLLYIAGHETTATFLGWFFYALGLHPEIGEKVYDEIDAVLGLASADEEIVSPTSEQIEQLTYTKMVINETLRMYPPATRILREIPETFEMKGHIFPKGVMLNSSPYLTHHNPEVWPEPEKFDPDRFTKENSANRHLYAFIPFSAGPRICLGKRFFYDEALIIIGTLLKYVRFEMDQTKENGKPTSNDPVLKASHVWLKPFQRAVSSKTI